MTKHNKIAKWVMLLTGAITIALVPIAIFVPIFASIFFFVPIEDVYTFHFLIGAFALLFGMTFVAVGLFMSPNSVKKIGGDKNEN